MVDAADELDDLTLDATELFACELLPELVTTELDDLAWLLAAADVLAAEDPDPPTTPNGAG